MIYYVAQTNANPLGIAFALLMGIFLVVLPRRYAIIPILALVSYLTMGTNIVVGGLNFTMLRFLLVFGWARLIIRKELRGVKLNRIDWAVIAFVVSSLITYTLLWQTYDAFRNKLGLAYNVLGFFFLFRYLIKDMPDAIRVVRIAAILIVPLAGLMILEKRTGHDLFAYFGGVPEMSPVRDGVIRCQGPFGHPILAGSFGATMLPFFIGLWTQKVKAAKLFAVIGIISASIVVICSGSSGPLLAGLAGIGGFFFWPLRKKMQLIRWAMVAGIVVLQIVMKPPFWFIIAKIDVFSGNTGWHRAHLIDIAYRNLSDWWLVGTRSVIEWDVGYDHNIDITNQYIAYGIDGGLITFFLFIAIIVRCFGGVGRTIKVLAGQPKASQLFVWSLGAALFAHVTNYFSISYFDQTIIAFYLLLAMISSLGDYAAQLKRSPVVPKVESSEIVTESYAGVFSTT
jgi:hypothetical protein